MDTPSPFFIAEAGVNHNGDLAHALELVDAAVDAGADAVKFQTFKAEELAQAGAKTADYQKAATGRDDQLAMLRALELDDEAHRKIAAHCEDCGIEFMSTPFDIGSAHQLLSLGMKRIKIPSGELTNLPFLTALAALDRPMILSTGMSDLAEVEAALTALSDGRRRAKLTDNLMGLVTILHCTSNYPAAPEDTNLRAIATMAGSFGLPVGYSDHTIGVEIPIAATALGATMIEKHMTLDRSLPGPDHKASMEPAEMTALIAQLRIIHRALGDGIKRPVAAEIPMRRVARRSIVLARAVAAGTRLTSDDLAAQRPGSGLAPARMGDLVGRIARRDLIAGAQLTLDDLS